MNRDFRLALLRNWKTDISEQVIDFTRYDLPAQEPPDGSPDKPTRNWSLMNRLSQKGTRPQDKPARLGSWPRTARTAFAGAIRNYCNSDTGGGPIERA
jgi:hypothetical protein